jgi:carbon-monoxide dehydrogenase medium subunit
MFRADYESPASLEELLSVLHQNAGEAKVIAGGTDLIPQMRLGKLSPKVLVDPQRIPSAGIAETEDSLLLGPLLTHTQVINSPLLKREYHALVEACQQVGGPPIRNRGTVAGNLANASPAADSALPLLIYDASVLVTSLAAEREIPLNEFYLGPGQTQLSPGEFIYQIRIPKTPPRSHAIFLKLGNRKAMAIAVASLAVRISLDERGKVSQARLALGSVAPTPLRAYQAEAMLQSNSLNAGTIQLAAEAARDAASPISDLRASADYRSKMVTVLVRRALDQICAEIAEANTHA